MMHEDEPKLTPDTSTALQAMRDVPTPGYDVTQGLARHRAMIAGGSSPASGGVSVGAKAFFGIAALAASVTLGALSFGRHEQRANNAGLETATAEHSTREQSPVDNAPFVEPDSTELSPTNASVARHLAEREIRELADAERLVAAFPSRALALARESDARFSPGYLRQERRFVIVRALVALRRRDEAKSEAARFYNQDKDPAFRARIEAVLQRD